MTISPEQAQWFANTFTQMVDNIELAVRGKERVVRLALTCLLSEGHLLLEDNHTMEVILVQGPASRLKSIADELITCKGVRSGKLTISSALIPPIHGRNSRDR